MAELPDGYCMADGSPSVEEYLQLRAESGLSPKTREQAESGLGGEWTACHVLHAGSRAVGMGRVISDGGWYYHIVDMAVLPQHQRRGLGDAIISELLRRIRDKAPPGAWVNLLADPPGRRLYARHGFVETAPGSVGMAVTLD